MNKFKKFKIIIVLLGILVLTPSASYALIDLGLYGGYSFAGEIETTGTKPEPKGFHGGFIGHVNQRLFLLFRAGLGLYAEYSSLEYSLAATDFTYTKRTLGVDLYLMLDIPLIPLDPYVKFATGIWEDVAGDLDSGSSFLNTYKTGIGLAFTFFPFLQLTGEYQFEYTRKIESNNENYEGTGHAVVLGIRFMM